MIGRVESGSLENDTYGQIHFAQRLLIAFWASRQGRIVKALLAFKLYSTIFAPVCINRHTITSKIQTTYLVKSQGLIIARSAVIGKIGVVVRKPWQIDNPDKCRYDLFDPGWSGDRGRAATLLGLTSQGRGKSALHRARSRVTPGMGQPVGLGHRNKPLAVSPLTGSKVEKVV